MVNKRQILWLILTMMVLGLSLSFSLEPALAHARIEVGPYVIIVGWVEEPVIVGERNAILIEVSRDEEPVTGLEGTLDINILYAGRTFIGDLSPTATPGLYHVEIFPTVRGQYTVLLSGTIEDQAIDERVDPEEVLSANVLQFPEVEPDLSSLQQTIDSLEAQLQTARLLAIIGLIAGILGVGLAGFGLVRKRDE